MQESKLAGRKNPKKPTKSENIKINHLGAESANYSAVSSEKVESKKLLKRQRTEVYLRDLDSSNPEKLDKGMVWDDFFSKLEQAGHDFPQRGLFKSKILTNLRKFKNINEYRSEEQIKCFSYQNTFLAFPEAGTKIRIVRIGENQDKTGHILTGHKTDIVALKFARKGSRMLSLSTDGHLIIWEFDGSTNFGSRQKINFTNLTVLRQIMSSWSGTRRTECSLWPRNMIQMSKLGF